MRTTSPRSGPGRRLALAGLATLAIAGALAVPATAVETGTATATAASASPAPTRVILTPTETPETSQSFTWLATTPTETNGVVQLRLAAGGPVRAVRATSQGTAINQANPHFSATVKGLTPATAYSYRVGSADGWSEWQTFSTADPTQTEFDYVYYGDAQIGLDTTWPKVVKMAEQTAPDSIGSVHAGDLIDTSSNDTQWTNWFKGMEHSAATTNIFAAPGNHEYNGDKLMRSWKAHFEYPDNNPNASTIGDLAQRSVGDDDVARQYQAYFDHWSDFARETVYFADYQGVRFITVNATRDSTFLTPSYVPPCTGTDCPSTKVTDLWTEYQAAWLDHVLDNSDSKWNVVTFHQPVYSASSGRDEPVLRKYWVPVFEEHNVDLVQMGHDHTYARGYNNDDLTAEPGVTDGPVYVVSNSGAKHYDLETDARNVWTNNGATQVIKGEKITTYQVISVSQDKLVYKSYLAETVPGTYTVPAKELEVGDVIDEFTVHKSDDGRKRVVEAGAPAPVFEDLTPHPVITAAPAAEISAAVGDTVTLHVAVDSSVPVDYQWQRRAQGDWSDIVNQDESSLVLEDVTARAGSFEYRVKVTAGSRTVFSAPTRLIITGPAAGTPTAQTPHGAIGTKQATQVGIRKARLQVGKKGMAWVRSTTDGTVKVTLQIGKKRVVRTTAVRAGDQVKVALGKIARKVVRKGGIRASVTAALTPAEPSVYDSARAVRKFQVRR
ncbi:fibronectin type III domain-containing protein [Nocardioides houyundeii]|uniref:fibronectin type III domain-containing protein n=1 Tax=Nocardioides houyundeii TaxID=2045452 RepID=UPI000DF3D0C7|nr:fibronectin type III domain-containing protein [Nocardioides houyundeii]